MVENEEFLELDDILSVLENPIRRKILRRLSQDSNYPLQLSRELNVSQQAIMKHLKVLEDSDFVVSFEEKSDKGGPPRKVYAPRKRYCIRIDIGPNTYSEEIQSFRQYEVSKETEIAHAPPPHDKIEIRGKVTGEMRSDIAGALPAFTDPALERMRMELESSMRIEDQKAKFRYLKILIEELNKELEGLENKRRKLLALKEKTFEETNSLITNSSKDPLEREVLSLYLKENVYDIEDLEELLEAKRKVIEETFLRLKRRFEM